MFHHTMNGYNTVNQTNPITHLNMKKMIKTSFVSHKRLLNILVKSQMVMLLSQQMWVNIKCGQLNSIHSKVTVNGLLVEVLVRWDSVFHLRLVHNSLHQIKQLFVLSEMADSNDESRDGTFTRIWLKH